MANEPAARWAVLSGTAQALEPVLASKTHPSRFPGTPYEKIPQFIVNRNHSDYNSRGFQKHIKHITTFA